MTGKKIGLVIGNNYKNSSRELQFAVDDARELKQILLDKNICEFDEVEELIDDTFINAGTKIEKILKSAKENALVFIYFSGHGQIDFSNELLLLFKDTRDECLLATSLSYNFIERCIRYPSSKSPKSVVIVLDCCYSGAAGTKGDDLAGVIKMTPGKGTIIITSTGSTGSQTAREDANLKHGVFTNFLIEGLKGGEPAGKDGYLYIDDLYEYIRKKMETYSPIAPPIPKFSANYQGKLVIGKSIKIIEEKKRLKIIEEKKRLKLLNEYRKTRQEWKSAGKQLELLDVSYEIGVNVLDKYIKNPLSLTDNENEIYSFLDNFYNNIFRYSTMAENIYFVYNGNPEIEFVRIPAGEFMMGSPEGEVGRYNYCLLY